VIKDLMRIIIQFCSKLMGAYVRAMYHEYHIRSEDGHEICEWFVVRGSRVGRDTSQVETDFNKRLDSEPQ